MLLAYLPIIVFETLSHMAIANMQMASLEKPKSKEPTMILME
ncbi:hypothetical protein [Bradyrhizobium manausense]|nr:hypothetical protein [Bradyrhizobium manausense]